MALLVLLETTALAGVRWGKYSLLRTADGDPVMALVDIYNQGTNKTTWQWNKIFFLVQL